MLQCLSPSEQRVGTPLGGEEQSIGGTRLRQLQQKHTLAPACESLLQFPVLWN